MSRLKNVLRVLAPVLIVGVAAVAAQKIVESRQVPEPTPPEAVIPLVRTVTAGVQSVTLNVEAQGTVLPRTETMLKAEVAARIVKIAPSLASGGFFEEGELLLELDATDFEANLQEAQAGVSRAEAKLAQEEADASIARRDWETMGRNDEPPPLVLRIPQLAEARAELAAAKAMKAKADRDIARTRILAPYAGRVRERMVDLGQFVDRGADLATIYAIDYAEVRLPVPDQDLALLDAPMLHSGSGVDAGPSVAFTARFGGNEHLWEGRVVRTEGIIDPETRCVILVARVDDPYGQDDMSARPPLLAGLFVDAVIEGRELPSAITLPREALRSNERVFVLGNEGVLEIREASVITGDADTVVLVGGVEPGERVVVSPVELPVDGMSLRDAEGATK